MMLLHMNDTSVLNSRRDGEKGYFKNKPTPQSIIQTLVSIYTHLPECSASCVRWLAWTVWNNCTDKCKRRDECTVTHSIRKS